MASENIGIPASCFQTFYHYPFGLQSPNPTSPPLCGVHNKCSISWAKLFQTTIFDKLKFKIGFEGWRVKQQKFGLVAEYNF